MRHFSAFILAGAMVGMAFTCVPADDGATAQSEQQMLLQAQQMADAAVARQTAAAETASIPGTIPLGGTGLTATHHTLGELANSVRLGPDYSDPKHHSMGEL